VVVVVLEVAYIVVDFFTWAAADSSTLASPVYIQFLQLKKTKNNNSFIKLAKNIPILSY